MSKVFKNIAVFPLWLAGLVIIAHLVIPHDHHSDCSASNKENECHADNSGHPVKPSGFPLHCHALNDMTFERTSSNFVVSNNIPTCDLLILSIPDYVVSSSGLSGIKIKDVHKLLTDPGFLRLSSLRGPPSLI